MTRARSRSQGVAAALLVVAALAHVPLIQEHLAEAPYVGWGFILLAATCLALAVWIALTNAPSAWVLTGAVSLAALVAFLASRTIGLPQIGDDVGNWTEPLGFPAMGSEALLVLLAAAHLQHLTHSNDPARGELPSMTRGTAGP